MYDIFHYAEWYMSCICQSVEFHIKSPRKTSPHWLPKSLSYPRDIIHCAEWHICAISISSEWYMSTICAPYLYMHTGICMTYYICGVVYVMYRVVYVIYMPRADLRFAALSRLAVAMKQSLSLRCDLLVNLLRITHRERLLCIIQLVARTPARGTLHCRTHSSVWHFVPVHWEKI